MRHVAPQLGLDTRRLIVGDVLSCIVGDDSNCFVWARDSRYFDPQLAISAKIDLLERLDWEAGLDEIPENIRTRLEVTKDTLAELDWSQWIQFKKARRIWYAVMVHVKNVIAETPEFNESLAYNLAMSQQLSEYWSTFLLGESRE